MQFRLSQDAVPWNLNFLITDKQLWKTSETEYFKKCLKAGVHSACRNLVWTDLWMMIFYYLRSGTNLWVSNFWFFCFLDRIGPLVEINLQGLKILLECWKFSQKFNKSKNLHNVVLVFLKYNNLKVSLRACLFCSAKSYLE